MNKVKHREDKNWSASQCKGHLEGLFGDACISPHGAHYKQTAQPRCHLIFHRKALLSEVRGAYDLSVPRGFVYAAEYV